MLHRCRAALREFLVVAVVALGVGVAVDADIGLVEVEEHVRRKLDPDLRRGFLNVERSDSYACQP